MHSMDKIKEKITIRLDTSEIGWLVVGCLLISTGVFAMGFYVGTSDQPAIRSHNMALLPSSLVKSPKEKSEVDEALADLQYTYDQELTSPTPPERIDDPALEIIARFKDQIQPSIHSQDINGPDLALAGPRPVNLAESAFEGEELTPKTHQKVAKLAQAKAPASSGPAWAKPAQQPTPGTKANAPKSSATAVSSGYTIQIRAFKKERDAKSFSVVLKNAGYKPYVVAAAIPGKGTYYRVRLGKFQTLSDATATQARFEKAESYSTIVTPI
jgi:cell division septation protein DedD